MSASIFECSICYTFFNETSHKPLVTQCGHVFCEECLIHCTISVSPKTSTSLSQEEAKIEDAAVDSVRKYDESQAYQLKCPACQKVLNTHPSQLTCVYQILAHLPQSSTQIMPGQNNNNSSSVPTQNQEVNYGQRQQTQQHHMAKSNSSNQVQSNQGYVTTQKGMKPMACMRHPDKKIKFFCESDVAFLCSKCVIQHTGVGHVITEYSLDIEKIRSDFQDVHKKYQGILHEAGKSKHLFESMDKKLSDMCHRQLSKLDLTYKSIANILESKRKEFSAKIREFYQDQKQKLELDRLKTGKFQSKIQSMQGEFDQIEKLIEFTAYEEFFKLMSQKSSELSDLQDQCLNLSRSASNTDKTLTLAVFRDQVKIADYGSICYIKAQEYKGKTTSSHNNNKASDKSPRRESSHSHSKKRAIVQQQPTDDTKKQIERAKQWALDEKVSKKLNNIINKIHDIQPVTSKNANSKDFKDFKSNIENSGINQVDNIFANTTSINASSILNKNLSSTMNSKQQQQQDLENKSQNRGVSYHNPQQQQQNQVPLVHQHKSDNDALQLIDQPSKFGRGMINEYEKNASSSNNRRVTIVPSLRTDIAAQSKFSHKTQQLIEKEDYSNIKYQNTTNVTQQMYNGAALGSMTHRPEKNRYANSNDNDFEYSSNGMINSGTAEKEFKKATGNFGQNDNLTYSKYLNPIKQQHQHNFNNLLQQSVETTKEQNPFENGLVRQTPGQFNDTLQDLDDIGDSAKHKNTKGGGGHLSSDDEMILTNMIQEITSKSQERRRTGGHNTNNASVKAKPEITPHHGHQTASDVVDNKLIKYTSNHCPETVNPTSSTHSRKIHNSKKQKKDHPKATGVGHHKPRRVQNDRYDNSQQPTHKRNGSIQQDEMMIMKGLYTRRGGDQTAQLQQDHFNEFPKNALQHTSNQNKYL